MMIARSDLPDALAAAFLAGPWTESAMRRRARSALAPPPRTPLPWLAPLVARVRTAYAHPPHDRPRELRAYVAAWLEDLAAPAPPPPRRFFLPPARMADRRP